MKIKNSRIQNARNFRSAELAFEAPCTIVIGPNGSGKSTAKDAIRTALFGMASRSEKYRLVSKFDPDSIPSVELELALNGTGAIATLKRNLTDDTGTWTEAGKTIRAKGMALRNVQSHLPISAAAADLLLCGDHANFSFLLEEFPGDVQSLMTAAAVQGSGPDPKKAIENVESDFKAAKSKSKKTPGILEVLGKKVQALETELRDIEQNNELVKELKKLFQVKTAEQKRLSVDVQSLTKELEGLKNARKRIREILDTQNELDSLIKLQGEWQTLEGRIQKAKRTTADVLSDVRQLESQYRVKKRSELREQIADLQQKLNSATDLLSKIENVQGQLETAAYPTVDDQSQLQKIESSIDTVQSKMEATGLSYRLVSQDGCQAIDVSQDGGPVEQVSFSPRNPVKGIVGNIVVQFGDVRFEAEGKEDIGFLKRQIDSLQLQKQNLLDRFDAKESATFMKLAQKRSHLEKSLSGHCNDLKILLGNQSVDQLQNEVSKASLAIENLGVTDADEKTAEHRVLPSSTELEKRIAVKQSQHDAAVANERSLESQQPAEPQKTDAIKKTASATIALNVAKSNFAESGCDLVPSQESYNEIEIQVGSLTSSLDKTKRLLNEIEMALVRNQADLEYSGKYRAAEEVQLERADARTELEKNELRQQARQFLVQRIGEKSSELATGIPSTLAQSVNKFLQVLTGGFLSGIEMNDDLSVKGLRQNGSNSIDWSSLDLSTGERTVAALSMRIAIAFSLAEHAGSAFLMLDDSFVNLDPTYRVATEKLLETVASDGRIQIILFTCHCDWADDWKTRASHNLCFQYIVDSSKYFQDKNEAEKIAH